MESLEGVSPDTMTNGSSSPDLIVIGGGVIGLAVAEAAASGGRSVTLLERDRCGRGASWAAGGMLSPLGEAEEPGPFLRLARASLELWPAWARRLAATSGIDVGFHLDGKTLVAFDPEARDRLRERFRWQSAAGHEVVWREGDAARHPEPALAADAIATLQLPGDGRVNNRRLVEALAAAARAAGVRIVEGCEVGALRTGPGGAVTVDTPDGPLTAPRAVLAAGAWAPALAGTAPDPVKGQMLSLDTPSRPLRAVVATPEVYLIPRETPDGPRVVVGATTERAGFDTSTDPAVIERLRAAAVRAVPALADAPIAERWAGLRPGSSDGLPTLGPDPDRPGLLHAHAHYRNGVLLAPVTAEFIVRWLDGRPPADAAEFAPR